MAVGDFIKQSPTNKQRVLIVTVDPETRRVEARTKDNAIVQIAVWETPLLFRWPVEEEWWTIYRESGFWMLDKRMDVDEPLTLEDLPVGDIRLSSPTGVIHVVSNANTTTLVKKFTAAIGDGTTTVFDIQHDLGQDITYVVRSGSATLLEGTSYTVSRISDSVLRLIFSVAPPAGCIINITG